MKLELFLPIKNPSIVTQKFGENLIDLYAKLGMKGHNGWDIIGNDGQLIRAAHNGEVTFAGEDGSGGQGIVIRTLELRELYYDEEKAEYISFEEAIKRGYQK